LSAVFTHLPVNKTSDVLKMTVKLSFSVVKPQSVATKTLQALGELSVQFIAHT